MRPRAGAGGKGKVLSANISPRARDLLEAEAARTGFSISQVADRWIVAAGEGAATYEQRIGGGPEVQAAFEKLARIVQAVERADPDAEFTTIALRAAIERSLPNLLRPHPHALAGLATALENHTAWADCGRVVAVLEAAPEDDPVVVRARQPLAGSGGLLGVLQEREHLFEALIPPSGIIPEPVGKNTLRALTSPTFTPDFPGEIALNALQELYAAGETARTQVATAINSVRKCLDRETAAVARWMRAADFGRRVADAIAGSGT
jgi:hypothetical protein